jgi:outer membrane lipoprotein-sorting protein
MSTSQTPQATGPLAPAKPPALAGGHPARLLSQPRTIRALLLLFSMVLFVTPCLAADAPAPPPTAAPVGAPTSRPASVDPAAWQRMLAIDRKAGEITDLTADFEQQKFTAMLKKPLVSSGRVFVRGSTMLWETQKPEPNVLKITDREVRIYYPQQKTIEVYQVQQKLGQLAASPVPRLAVLERHFTFEPIPVSEMGESDAERFFAVRMTPTQPELREHVEQVRVLLDAQRGLIVRLEMRDADGDRTRISFSNVKTNVGLKDAELAIHAPPDVKVTRPLAAVEGAPPSPSASDGSTGPQSKGK